MGEGCYARVSRSRNCRTVKKRSVHLRDIQLDEAFTTALRRIILERFVITVPEPEI